MKDDNNNVDWIFNKATANTLKKYRELSGLSLEEVTSKMKNNISRQSLFKYENNLARIKNNTFIDLCHVLKIDPNEVFDEIVTSTCFYKEYIDKDYVAKENVNGELREIDLSQPIINYDNSDLLNQYQMLFDKDDTLTDEQKKFFMDFLEEKHSAINKEKEEKGS